MACTGCNDDCIESVELAQGNQGIFGGFSASWRKNSGTSSSVSAGGLTFNNVSMISATAIYVHKTNIDNIDHTNFLNSFSNGGNFGLIRIFKESDSSVFWYGELTAVSLASNVFTLTVTNIQSSLSSGTIPTNTNLVLTFSPKGDDGTSGLSLLSNSLTDSSTIAAASPQTLKSYTLVGNTLSVNNDYIEVDAVVDGSGDSTLSSYKIAVYFGGINVGSITIQLGAGKTSSNHINVQINRISSTSERVVSQIQSTSSNGMTYGSLIGTISSQVYPVSNNTAINLASNQNIEIIVSRNPGSFTSGQWTCRKLTVKHIKQ